jgi:hypothetical protein
MFFLHCPTLIFLVLVQLVHENTALNVVVQHHSQLIIWLLITLHAFTSSRVRSNERPDNCNDSRADAALCQQLQLQFFNAKNLVHFLSLCKAAVVEIFVLRLCNLEANAHFFLWNFLAHIFLDCKGAENIPIVLCLMVLAKLVTHYHSTHRLLCLASG